MTETKKAAEAKKPEVKAEDKKVETKTENKKTEVKADTKADTNVKFVEPKTSSVPEKKAPAVKPVIENPKFQAPDFSIHLANTTGL